MASNKSILQRTEELEQQVLGFRSVAGTVQQLQGATNKILAILAAFIQEMGGAELDKRIEERLIQQQQEFMAKRLEDQKRVLGELVKNGTLITLPAVTKDSIITFQEFQSTPAPEGSPEGTAATLQLTQDYVQLHITQLDPQVIAKVLDQPVGTSVELNGFVLKITGIYGTNPTPPTVSEPPVDPTPAAQGTDAPPADTPAPTPEAAAPEAPATDKVTETQADVAESTTAPETTNPDVPLVTPRQNDGSQQ